ncbi:pantoate--beta-alanine ligase [Candidatus Thioglobus sp.]|uniref:pantoate--beta-alanine ligase n=1 Tax=Candidatus Thioglobus sp. TaxID=2026721 RepID=UPI003D130E95
MQICSTNQQIFDLVSAWKVAGKSIAFVPTMGGLHQGHLSLVEQAALKADKVIVSIFVNPAQFAQHEDFGEYPRDLNKDLTLLEALQVDCVFTPNIEMIYPEGIKSDVKVGAMGQILCGKTRPHFFDGVVQVVRRLFDIVKPDMAIFGKKDCQQLQIIKKFTSKVEIIGAPTVREHDGLAMSTRNQYLNKHERKIAPQLHKVLLRIEQGELDLESASKELQQHFKLDYLQMLDANTLKSVTGNSTQIAILCAVFLGSNRLIDNIIFNQELYIKVSKQG